MSANPEIIQQSEAWFQSRSGMISASKMADMMSKGDALTRKKYMYSLATERLTGKVMPQGFKSKRMEQGNILEPEGRALYEFYYDEIEQVGFIKHPNIPNYGASPDGQTLDGKGGLELKNRDLLAHYDLYFNRKPPRDALLQMYAQMSCCGFDWVDYGSYNLDKDEDGELILPSYLRLVVVRVERSQGEIATLEKEVVKFDKEINELVKKLKKNRG